ncbi:D-galactarate dehydratase [Tropicimonas sp. IMCC34043]|uniref:D-galactarate dehydratase n=1 Tax=Tropicimonas sp. IMCC34043 TaxID=2248760 RepID=UPI000E2536FB|nr:D-galactarate dehydratase [Tropicimonas sp. IMCC34043]
MNPNVWTALAAVALLAGCSELSQFGGPGKPLGAPMQTVAGGNGGASVTPAAMQAPPPPKAAVTPEQFDTTTEAQRAAAATAPAATGERRLGTTIASLGDPADPGFWAETGLVTERVSGRLQNPITGESVQVELRPSGAAPGAGTRVSLPAMRVLELPLTGLPELIVYRN